MTTIYLLSAQSGSSVGLPAPWDKVAHAIEYAILGYLLAKATGNWRAALILAAWYGALDEVHQAFIPNRLAGIDDWWADLTGALLGARIGRHQRPPRRAPPQVA